MTVKGILPSTLNMIIKTRYPLPVQQQPSILPPSDIPPSPSPLPSDESEPFEDDQIESELNSPKARVDDDMTRKYSKMKPERSDQDKRGEIPLGVHEEKNVDRIEPEQRTFG